MLGNMVKRATSKGIEGMESLVGVPGTVGGALYMNAGAYKHEISNYCLNVIVKYPWVNWAMEKQSPKVSHTKSPGRQMDCLPALEEFF